MNVDRELVPTNYPSGKYCPKAARLTPAVQSGILSTFAAYMERQYYASQGQANSWDESEWGPTHDKRRFVFSPGGTVVTNARWRISSDVTGEFDLDETEEFMYWSIYDPPGREMAYVCRAVAEALGLRSVSSSPQLWPCDEDDEELSYTFTFSDDYGSLTTNIALSATRYIDISREYGDEWFYSPTNRIIGTRRLVQYDNIDSLADFVLDGHMDRGFIHTAPTRPGWIAGDANAESVGFEPASNRLWWATTDTSILADSQIVPSLDWARYGTVSSDWDNCSLTFECLRSFGVWTNTVHAEYGRYTPAMRLLDEIDLGDNRFDQFACIQSLRGNMPEQITNVYPHADPFAITNRTRRLVSDRIATVNQTLGLMDRTYHVPQITYPATCREDYYERFVDATGSVTIPQAVLEYNESSGLWRLHPSDVAWGEWRSGLTWGSLSAASNEVLSTTHADDSGRIYHRIGRTSTEAAAGQIAPAQRVFQITLNEDYAKLVISYVLNHHSQPPLCGTMTVRLYFRYGERIVSEDYVYVPIVVQVNTELGESASGIYNWGVLAEFELSDLTLVGDFRYARRYDHYHTLGDPALGVHQQGWEGTVAAYADGGMISFGHRAGDTNVWSYSYKTSTGDGPSGQWLEYRLSNEVSRIQSRINSAYGCNPTNCNAVIPIDTADAARVRDSVCFSNVTFQLYPYEMNLVTCVVDVVEIVTPEDISIVGTPAIYREREITPGVTNWVPIGTGWATVAQMGVAGEDKSLSSPHADERRKHEFAAKLGFITRTDWNWKALKREDN